MHVLDASAATAIACGTNTGMALKFLLVQGERVISADLLWLDLANALAPFMRMRAVSKKVAGECISLTLSMVDEFVPAEELASEAFAEAARCDIPVGELLYFCLARRHGATLITTSRKLMDLCEKSGVDYAAAELPSA